MPRDRSRYLPAVITVGGLVGLLAVWPGRLYFTRGVSPASDPVADSPVSLITRTAPVTRTSLPSSVASVESERAHEERLLANVGALAAEFDRLRALHDDIDRLRQSAEIENEFASLLDAETAALLIRKMPPGFADTHFGALALAKWAAAERVVAATWMAAHPAQSATASAALARGWFVEDSATLHAHLDRLPPGPWKTRLAITAGEDAFLAHDSQAVLGLLDRADAADVRRAQLIEWNTTAWAKTDVEAAAAWAAREPQPARREVLFAAVAIGQANVDSAAASVRLLQTVTETEALASGIRAVVRLWAVRDLDAVEAWVNRLPEGRVRQEAEESLLTIVAP